MQEGTGDDQRSGEVQVLPDLPEHGVAITLSKSPVGVVSDSDLVKAISTGADGLAGAVTRDYHAVTAEAVISDFMQYAGRHLVPVTVVDSEGRLAGVVPRAVILSALSGSALASTSGVSNA